MAKRYNVDIDEVELMSNEVSVEELERIMYEKEKVKVDLLKEFTPPGLKAKSEVTVWERYNFSRLELLAAPFMKVRYKNALIEKFIANYLEYGISLHRQGRKETKEVLQSFYASTLGEEEMVQEGREDETVREKLRRLLLT